MRRCVSTPSTTGTDPVRTDPLIVRIRRAVVRTVPVAVVAAGSGLPLSGTAQDTASAPERAWIGIRFSLEAHVAPGGRGSYSLTVRDVYGNGPADRVGILAGDRLVSIDGNVLETYEAWLRSTSDLGPGQTLQVRLLRDADEREVTVVADRRPAYFTTDRLHRLEWERARFDSLFNLFFEVDPRGDPWREYRLPEMRLPPEWLGPDPAMPEVTLGDSGPVARGDIAVGPGSLGRQIPARSRRGTAGGAEGVPNTPRELRRREEADAERGGGARTLRTRSDPETAPSVVGGGGPGPYRLYRANANPVSVLTPQLLGTTVVLGGAVVRDLTTGLGRYFGVEAGVLVTDVIDDATPAAQAGFLPGDIIVSVEGREIGNLAELRRVLADKHPPIEIAVIRRKKSLTLGYPSR